MNFFGGGGGWCIHSMWNFPNQESNPQPLQCKHGVLPTRPPGKSKVPMIKYHYFMPIKAETVLPKGNLISHCKTYPSCRDITMWGNASYWFDKVIQTSTSPDLSSLHSSTLEIRQHDLRTRLVLPGRSQVYDRPLFSVRLWVACPHPKQRATQQRETFTSNFANGADNHGPVVGGGEHVAVTGALALLQDPHGHGHLGLRPRATD